MTDRERIYFACLHQDFAHLLDELERDCLESRVIDQVLGLADLSTSVVVGLREAIAAYPPGRWQGDEAFAAFDLITSTLWWQGLIAEFEDVPLPACRESLARACAQ